MKILIITGHPDQESFNYALTEAYYKGAIATGATITRINIGELDFDPNLRYGYRQRCELEPDLQDALDKIQEADHIVWFFPMWWYGYPAIMKGFIDRTFLPGLTYQPVPGKPFPKKLLKGKTSRIVITSDTPRWYDRLFMGQPTINQFKKGTLQFCGINPVKVTYISVIKGSTDEFRQKWLNKITRLGKNLK